MQSPVSGRAAFSSFVSQRPRRVAFPVRSETGFQDQSRCSVFRPSFIAPRYTEGRSTELEQPMSTPIPRPDSEATASLFASGGDGGYSSQGDVLVNQTADGVDLSRIWDEAATALSLVNRERSALAALISHPTIAVGDAIPQQVASENFEKASEYGEPEGIRSNPDALILGYDFEDYDLASPTPPRPSRASGCTTCVIRSR